MLLEMPLEANKQKAICECISIFCPVPRTSQHAILQAQKRPQENSFVYAHVDGCRAASTAFRIALPAPAADWSNQVMGPSIC